MIRAHCMGMEFPKPSGDPLFDTYRTTLPKRDTDGPLVKWVMAYFDQKASLPSSADLDAVAEEQRVKEKTGAKVPNR